MMSPHDDLWIEVDLDAIAANYRTIAAAVGGKKGVIAVVKANGYGHGLIEVARTLAEAGAPMLAVSHLAEGRALREAGITAPILLMVPPLPEYYAEILSLDLLPALDSADKLAALSRAAGEGTARFQLKLNCGMNRFGLNAEELPDFLAALQDRSNLRLDAVFSHLCCAMKPDRGETAQHLARFAQALEPIRSALDYDFDIHLANSAAALTEPAARYDYVRVGTILYGQTPAVHLKDKLPLQNTWQAKTRIVAVRRVRKGERVGYGGDFKCRSDRTLGVLPIGYTDGFGLDAPLNNVTAKQFFRRSAKLLRSFVLQRPNHTVRYRGRALSVIGRIAMQTTVIDLADSGAARGDEVQIPVRRTAVSPLIKTVYLHGTQKTE